MVRAKTSQREIREIPKKEILRKEIPKRQVAPVAQRRNTPIYPPRREYAQPSGKKSHSGLWIVAIISIIIFIFALSFLFARAEVTVYPKIKDVTLNQNLSAIKDLNPDGLAFDLVIISGEDTKEVAGGEVKEVALPAKGMVYMYNAFSALPQKLAINSRLEGSNGKIYKTISELTIPGMQGDGTPGRVQVGIYAAEAGEEYNSTPLDFKISGFKGTSKYDKFYGRSDGNISGGFKGMSGVVTDLDKENAFTELRTSLQAKLLQKATEQIPDGFILFKDAAFLSIDEQNVEFSATGPTVPLTTKGTLYGFLFNEKNLTQKIAKDTVPEYNDEEVYIPNIKDLTFAMPAPTSPDGLTTSYSTIQSINFTLSGNAKIVWRFDDRAFQESLLGKSKSEFNQILSQYPNADSAELNLSPFWIRTLPGKLKDIKVVVDYPVVNSE